MTEHKFFAALTFCLLAGGTAAVGTELFAGKARAPAPLAQVVTLPPVSVIGNRGATLAEVVTLPQVTVTARREATAVVTLPQVLVTGRRPAPTRLADAQAGDAPSSPTGARGPFLRSPGMSHI